MPKRGIKKCVTVETQYRHENNLSWHERSDMKHCDLVSRDIHGEIRHSGGVYECKIRDGVDVRSKFDV